MWRQALTGDSTCTSHSLHCITRITTASHIQAASRRVWRISGFVHAQDDMSRSGYESLVLDAMRGEKGWVTHSDLARKVGRIKGEKLAVSARELILQAAESLVSQKSLLRSAVGSYSLPWKAPPSQAGKRKRQASSVVEDPPRSRGFLELPVLSDEERKSYNIVNIPLFEPADEPELPVPSDRCLNAAVHNAWREIAVAARVDFRDDENPEDLKNRVFTEVRNAILGRDELELELDMMRADLQTSRSEIEFFGGKVEDQKSTVALKDVELRNCRKDYEMLKHEKNLLAEQKRDTDLKLNYTRRELEKATSLSEQQLQEAIAAFDIERNGFTMAAAEMAEKAEKKTVVWAGKLADMTALYEAQVKETDLVREELDRYEEELVENGYVGGWEAEVVKGGEYEAEEGELTEQVGSEIQKAMEGLQLDNDSAALIATKSERQALQRSLNQMKAQCDNALKREGKWRKRALQAERAMSDTWQISQNSKSKLQKRGVGGPM